MHMNDLATAMIMNAQGTICQKMYDRLASYDYWFCKFEVCSCSTNHFQNKLSSNDLTIPSLRLSNQSQWTLNEPHFFGYVAKDEKGNSLNNFLELYLFSHPLAQRRRMWVANGDVSKFCTSVLEVSKAFMLHKEVGRLFKNGEMGSFLKIRVK